MQSTPIAIGIVVIEDASTYLCRFDIFGSADQSVSIETIDIQEGSLGIPKII